MAGGVGVDPLRLIPMGKLFAAAGWREDARCRALPLNLLVGFGESRQGRWEEECSTEVLRRPDRKGRGKLHEGWIGVRRQQKLLMSEHTFQGNKTKS